MRSKVFGADGAELSQEDRDAVYRPRVLHSRKVIFRSSMSSKNSLAPFRATLPRRREKPPPRVAAGEAIESMGLGGGIVSAQMLQIASQRRL